jgi:hypothetical protein
MFENRKIHDIFPIILGEIKKNYNEFEFWPINFKQTCLINKIISKKYRTLSNLERKLFILSDGVLSIDAIINTIYNDYKDTDRIEIFKKKSLKFFLDIFSNNYGLGFAKSWRS